MIFASQNYFRNCCVEFKSDGCWPWI